MKRQAVGQRGWHSNVFHHELAPSIPPWTANLNMMASCSKLSITRLNVATFSPLHIKLHCKVASTNQRSREPPWSCRTGICMPAATWGRWHSCRPLQPASPWRLFFVRFQVPREYRLEARRYLCLCLSTAVPGRAWGWQGKAS